MWNKVKDTIVSRKFILFIIGTLACGTMAYFGISQELIAIVAGLCGVTIAGTAVQDIGKK